MKDYQTATWREKLFSAADGDVLIHITLTEEELDLKFDDGFGCAEGIPFTAWSERYVYFPTEYDGAESVGKVLRNPCDEPTEHQ